MRAIRVACGAAQVFCAVLVAVLLMRAGVEAETPWWVAFANAVLVGSFILGPGDERDEKAPPSL